MDPITPPGAPRRTMVTVLAAIGTLTIAFLAIMTMAISDQFDDEPPITMQKPTGTATTPAASDDRPTPAARSPSGADGLPTTRVAVPRTPPGSWISPDDYPQSALRADEQGRSVALIDIAASGYPRGCAIIVSSGSAALDDATCRVAMRHARFIPARNAAGVAVAAQWTFPVRWVLPQ